MSDNYPLTEQEPVSEQPLRFKRFLTYLSYVAIGVLRLRRVQVALTTILVSLLILWFPHLETMQDNLLLIVAAILMVGLGGYSVGDALNHGKPTIEQLDDLLDDVADELGVDAPMTQDESEELSNAQT